MSASDRKDYPIAKKTPREWEPGERRVMAPQERERLAQDTKERREEYEVTPQDGPYGYVREDASRAMDSTVRRQNRKLKQQAIPQLSPQERARWVEEAKKLEDWLADNMVPRKQMALRNVTDPDYRKAVNHVATIENSSRFQQVVDRWKNIMRALHPGDPSASNLERVRQKV